MLIKEICGKDMTILKELGIPITVGSHVFVEFIETLGSSTHDRLEEMAEFVTVTGFNAIFDRIIMS